jgi:hypothetical protein
VDAYPLPLKPTWSSSTFLQYLGTGFALVSLASFFSVLQDEHGSWCLAGVSLLGLSILLGLAVVAQRRGENIVAGLLSVVAVLCWTVLVGSLLDIVGFDLAPDVAAERFFNTGLAFGMLVLELLVIIGAALVLARFHFPLIVLIIAAVAWYAVMDLLEGVLGGGDTATAILALAIGLAFVAVAASMDGDGANPSAFWLHVVGGLSVGGAFLWFWHERTWEWLLILVISLGYIGVARVLGRSSYAVLGAVGLAGTATYFIEKWFSLGTLVPYFAAEPESVDKWGRPLVYLALGAVFVALGVVIGLSRATSPAPAAVPPPAQD